MPVILPMASLGMLDLAWAYERSNEAASLCRASSSGSFSRVHLQTFTRWRSSRIQQTLSQSVFIVQKSASESPVMNLYVISPLIAGLQSARAFHMRVAVVAEAYM